MAKKKSKHSSSNFNLKPTRAIQRAHKTPFGFAAGFSEVKSLTKLPKKEVMKDDNDKEYRRAILSIRTDYERAKAFTLGKWHEEFARPSTISVCRRRKARRAALFRIGFAGSGAVKQARWTELSKVSCK